ncbi:glycosyltransferase family 2 protein [Mucilaginibacter sp. AW1-7]|uniref:glycosyltransferase family 2 protein n=1 Tax=Mucilaginibacter sp. AW1-7 TaxID=3349874 RepID=UPI003F73A130
MGSGSLVSILIPVYNRETLVGKAIDCSLSQTYKNIEVIVIDNCSTDNTWKVLGEYAGKDPRVRIFRNAENLGPVGNWMECIKQSKGEYVKFLFSDDWFDDDYIEKTIDYLENNPDVGLVFSKTMLHQFGEVVGKYDNFGENKVFASKDFIYRYIRSKGNVPVSPGCAIFRKTDIQKSLLYNIPNPLGINYPRTGGGNDVLLFLLTAARYKNVGYVHNTNCHFLGGDDSITRNEDLIMPYLYATAFFLNSYRTFTWFYKAILGTRYIYYLIKRHKFNVDRIKEVYFLIR